MGEKATKEEIFMQSWRNIYSTKARKDKDRIKPKFRPLYQLLDKLIEQDFDKKTYIESTMLGYGFNIKLHPKQIRQKEICIWYRKDNDLPFNLAEKPLEAEEKELNNKTIKLYTLKELGEFGVEEAAEKIATILNEWIVEQSTAPRTINLGKTVP